MEQLSVEVMAVRWSGDDFAVLAAITDDGEEVTLTGPLAHVHEGESLELGGAWREHPKHGRQFAVERVRIAAPASEDALVSYLSSVKHVGPVGAAWLFERHGAAVLEAIDRDPGGRLAEVPGIGSRRLPAAVRSWEQRGAERAIRLFLDEHGVPAAAASRLVRAMGAGAIDRLRTDPYSATEVEGIGFATADALARALGFAADDPARIEAGVVHALREAQDDGHCFLPRGELEYRAAKFLGAEVDGEIGQLAASGRLIVDPEDRVIDPLVDAIERRLARNVRDLLGGKTCLTGTKDRPTVVTDTQWRAVELALEHRLSILTGGPGTGKTTTMRALVEVVRGSGSRVRLCAPTGKAARRLAEVSGHDATTIHRLLEWSGEEGGFTRDESDPIPGADLLVVDEASMLSLRLADALFRAVGPRTHVLLVGDADQLPPVGAGRVLDDLIESDAVPAVRLTEIFRQAERSLIVRAAHAINHGELPPTQPDEDGLRDFFALQRGSAQEIFEEVVSLATERMPAHYGFDPVRDIQVLAPMYRGTAGIDALNEALRARINPDGRPIAGTAFRVGDKVVETVNNHELMLMNGQTGVIVTADPKRDEVVLATDDERRLTVSTGETATWRLAYCLSIHKSQGGQWPGVIVALATEHRIMLTRELLYTGLTRAASAAVGVWNPGALQLALERRSGRRHTRLAELVVSG